MNPTMMWIPTTSLKRTAIMRYLACEERACGLSASVGERILSLLFSEDNDTSANEVAKREKARLKEMQKLKKLKIQEILDALNAAIDADMNEKGNGRLNYLLQQIELFAHFAKGDQPASQKKAKGRGRHASKMTEQEEDEKCLKKKKVVSLGVQPSCGKGIFSLILLSRLIFHNCAEFFNRWYTDYQLKLDDMFV